MENFFAVELSYSKSIHHILIGVAASNDIPLQLITNSSLFWLRSKQENPVRSVAELPATQSETYKPIFLKLLKRGIYLAPNAYEVGFVSAAHTGEPLERFQEALKETLMEVYGR